MLLFIGAKAAIAAATVTPLVVDGELNPARGPKSSVAPLTLHGRS